MKARTMTSRSVSARPDSALRQRGLTLVELMVSLVIGLVVVIATSAVFVSSSKSRQELDVTADVVETGRYALLALSNELTQTGFYSSLVTPDGTAIDVCSTSVTAWASTLAVYAFGYNNNVPDPACITRKAGTDAIFVQRASTCAVGECAEAESADNAYLQVSECGSEYSATPSVLAKGGDATPFTLQTKACDGTRTPKRKLVRRVFYITGDDRLVYNDITLSGTSDDKRTVIAEGIEQMQLSYAIDTNGDGTPDDFSATPTDWSQVIGVRVWLLARSEVRSAAAAAAMTFEMDDTTVTQTAAASNFKRRLYSTYIPFVTPTARRQS